MSNEFLIVESPPDLFYFFMLPLWHTAQDRLLASLCVGKKVITLASHGSRMMPNSLDSQNKTPMHIETLNKQIKTEMF